MLHAACNSRPGLLALHSFSRPSPDHENDEELGQCFERPISNQNVAVFSARHGNWTLGMDALRAWSFSGLAGIAHGFSDTFFSLTFPLLGVVVQHIMDMCVINVI